MSPPLLERRIERNTLLVSGKYLGFVVVACVVVRLRGLLIVARLLRSVCRHLRSPLSGKLNWGVGALEVGRSVLIGQSFISPAFALAILLDVLS